MKKIYSVDRIEFDSHGVAGKTRVIAEGQVNTGGWGQAQLLQSSPEPLDGYRHFDLMAEPPNPGDVVVQVFEPRRAMVEISTSNLKGVTVHASTNHLTKDYPGGGK